MTPNNAHKSSSSSPQNGPERKAARPEGTARAAVPSGKRRGSYTGRVAVRETGSFNIQTGCGTVQGVPYRFCSLIQPADGYAYGATKPQPRGFLPVLKDGASAASF